VQEVAGTTDAIALFKKIFVNNDSGTPDPNAMITPVVDRVYADYMRLRTGSTRLSSDDWHRLDDHMQRLSELRRQLSVHTLCPGIPPVTTDTNAARNTPSFPVDPSLQNTFYQAMNDVIVAAILCDTSRIATLRIPETFSTFQGDWHQDVAHHASDMDGVKQQVMVDAHQLTFENVFLDLCSKLNVDDGMGQTYLDN
jgi:Protein of unknown function (DUF1552)